MPKRVASTRSNAVGVPPRWVWPSTVVRVSKPVRDSISPSSRCPIPPRRSCPNSSVPALTVSIVPSRGSAPSATTTMENDRPREWRREISRHTSSTSNGRSGIRITSAPPARPECSAIQPAWRPITSTTITRLWLSAVVCRRSMASVATCSAVSKPKVRSVAPRSLSIVLGTPTTGTSCSECSRAAAPSVSSPADGDQPVDVQALQVALEHRRPVVALEGVGARGAEDRPAAREDPPRRLDRELEVLVLERPAPAVAEANQRVAVVVDALAHDGADRRVEPRAVAAAGQDSDPHPGQSTRAIRERNRMPPRPSRN